MTAIKATLHSYKSLATRKQLQITLEVPQEYADTALKMLGVADPSGTQWFGLTRLNAAEENGSDGREPESLAPSTTAPDRACDTHAGTSKVSKDSRTYTRSQKAALKCGSEDFQVWLAGAYPTIWDMHYIDGKMLSPEAATATLKKVLGIASRKELDEEGRAATAFDQLIATYDYRDQVRA